MTHMTIWLHPTKSIVPIREFLLIQIYNVNSITFPETEELQCSIFRCIPAPYPKSEWGPIPKCGGLDPTTLVGLLLRTLQTPILLRIESPNADTQVCTQQSCSCSAPRPPFFCSHAFLCGAFVTCDLSPLTLRLQVRTRNTRLDNWPDPSPSTGVSASLFFLIHFFLLFVHPKIAAPL